VFEENIVDQKVPLFLGNMRLLRILVPEEIHETDTIYIPWIFQLFRGGIPGVPVVTRLVKANKARGRVVRESRDLIRLLEDVLDGILFIRHPDISGLKEPKPFAGGERLSEDSSNLAPVLLSLQGRRGALPGRISDALRRLFPGVSIRLESHMGRVALVFEEGGVELPPPNISDGLVKLLALMTAVELDPSILLIDELENSMHAYMLEYVVDVLNELSIPVVAATHSPILVDLAGPERTLIVSRKPGEGTIVEKIEDANKLLERLREEGVVFSDYVFYGRTRPENP